MFNLEHFGRFLMVLLPVAAGVSLCAWLVRRTFSVETTGRERGLLIGGVAGLLELLPLADNLPRSALISGGVVLTFFLNKVVSSVLSRRGRADSNATNR